MGSLVVSLAVYGIGIAAAPWCIVGVLLLLTGGRPLPNGIAFVCGFLATLTLTAVAVALLTDRVSDRGARRGSTGSSVATLVAGVALLGCAWWLLRRRPAAPPGEPGWLARLDRVGPPLAFGFGMFMPTVMLAV